MPPDLIVQTHSIFIHISSHFLLNLFSILSLLRLFRFPKDTAEEQIAALSDEEYVTAHFWFHNALLVCLALTAFSLPKIEDDKKEASKKFAMPTGSPVADAFAEKTK